jgi:dUTP pyrophosphatase
MSAYVPPLRDISTLKIFIDSNDDELKKLYQIAVSEHNHALEHDGFPNAGFDLFVPEEIKFTEEDVMQCRKIDFGLKTEVVARVYSGSGNFFDLSKAFYLYARSSISKTPLMVANHVGIVDSGYRGNLIGAVRLLGSPYCSNCTCSSCSLASSNQCDTYVVEKYTRLFQICMGNLEPFRVELVETVDALSTTSRGAGGFGSTGLVGVTNTTC